MTDDVPQYVRDFWPEKAPRTHEDAPSATNGARPGPDASTAYARAAFTAEVDALAAQRHPGRNDRLNVAAFNLGQLVGGGLLDYDATWSALYDTAVGTGLTEAESRSTTNSGMAAGMAEPRTAPEQDPLPPVTEFEPPPGVEGLAEPRWPEPVDWDHLWWSEDEDAEWVVEPIIPARRLVALYSPPKVGKSLLMLEVAVGIARGVEVLGFTPARPRRVLYVDLENDPRGDIRTRLQQMGRKPSELGDLVYLSFPDLPNLDTAMGGLRLMEVVEHFSAEVVVIDTISRIVAGEENANDTWLAFYRHTGKALKAAGVTCVRLDHTGKDISKGMRGGSAKYGDVDLVWSLTKPGGDETLVLDCTAQRTPVPQRTVVLTRKSDPWLHHEVEREGKAAAVHAEQDDLVRFIDQIEGRETQVSTNAAMKLLKANGRGRRWDVVADAMRMRDIRFNDSATLDGGLPDA